VVRGGTLKGYLTGQFSCAFTPPVLRDTQFYGVVGFDRDAMEIDVTTGKSVVSLVLTIPECVVVQFLYRVDDNPPAARSRAT
jgi:hypothetical protein